MEGQGLERGRNFGKEGVGRGRKGRAWAMIIEQINGKANSTRELREWGGNFGLDQASRAIKGSEGVYRKK